MTGLSTHRLTALAEQMTGWRKAQLARYIRDGNAIHSRWLIARITLLTLTGTLVARSLFPGLPPLGAAVVGAHPDLLFKPVMRVEGACASGGLAFASAVESIQAGTDITMVVGAEVQTTQSARVGAKVLVSCW